MARGKSQVSSSMTTRRRGSPVDVEASWRLARAAHLARGSPSNEHNESFSCCLTEINALLELKVEARA